jgi:hypothetical protein
MPNFRRHPHDAGSLLSAIIYDKQASGVHCFRELLGISRMTDEMMQPSNSPFAVLLDSLPHEYLPLIAGKQSAHVA